MKKVMKNPAFASVAEDMVKSDCCQEDMVKSGEKALVMIYNGVERSVRRWSKAQSTPSHIHNRLLLQLPSITVCVYTIRYRTGKAIQEIYSQSWQNGGLAITSSDHR